ncbi:glycosyltransferase family 4 protein [Sphingomonas sp. BIUV-7]|uniref:Glycosyltransferase family 4 protein n=1 Tax=Sphingomonas natans TaxID=3063330 RepID=A0ABT8YCU2_9SPHN|nr:glycosyltransferase family 4 protein [Sphingomonas sp. BIUV-7]MDO6415767.1 glycosyltransferase family 4 protein [Sphingomonas sp. BIUV-7]
MRLTIVQYAGDYREAYERFAAGGAATYQAQRYSVDTVGALAARLEQVAVVCGVTAEPYDVILGNGVRAIGAGFAGGFDGKALAPLVAGTAPDRLALMTPLVPLIDWALERRIRTIAMLADSFGRAGVRGWIRAMLLARKLNRPTIEWIGNHGLNACLSLMAIGVSPAKIVPWDWPSSFSPHDAPPRQRQPGPLRLFYVGGINEAKGVGDLLEAVGLARREGRDVRLTIHGRDDGDAMAMKARALGLADAVRLAGPIANEAVVGAMREADAVVVPSRHDYPEGLPLTIYETLASRTPLLASDHPMFRGAITDGVSALVFRASHPASLARSIAVLADDADLYARLSANGAAAWDALQLPVRWGEMLAHWLADEPEDRSWLAGHASASGLYDERFAARRRAMAGE